MRKRLLLLGLVVAAVGLAIFLAYPTGRPPGPEVHAIRQVSCPLPGPTDAGAVTLSYGADPAQVLDLAVPAGSGPAAGWPVVLMIHGGRWYAGDKAQFASEMSSLPGLGYAAASMNYRLICAPDGGGLPGCDGNTFPVQADDARAAVALLKTTAGLNPHKVVVIGTSAGGTLAATLGTDPDVHATATFYTPVDFVVLDPGSPYVGDADAVAASPLYQVSDASTPWLVVHGTANPEVSYQQAVELVGALEDAGVRTRFVSVADGGHGFPILSPDYLQSSCALLQFLANHT